MATREPTEPVHQRWPRGLLQQVDDAAESEDRNRTKMTTILLREALEARARRRKKP